MESHLKYWVDKHRTTLIGAQSNSHQPINNIRTPTYPAVQNQYKSKWILYVERGLFNPDICYHSFIFVYVITRKFRVPAYNIILHNLGRWRLVQLL